MKREIIITGDDESEELSMAFVIDGERVAFKSHFQNFKQFGIPKAQLILTDIPYNIGKDAYGSNPVWYIGGDNRNVEVEAWQKPLCQCQPREIFDFLRHLGYEGELTINEK